MSYFGGYRSCGRKFLNPRTLTGGSSAYVFRRETRLERDPSWSVATKLKEKEGIIFGGARDFWSLGEDTRSLSGNNPFRLTNEELIEEVQENEEQTQTPKKKKKKKITSDDIRKHLRNVVKYHEQKVLEQFPCVYPMIEDIQEEDKQSKKEDSAIYNKPAPAKTLHIGSQVPPPGKGGPRKRKATTQNSSNKRTRK